MNLERFKRLTRLANNNPNEHEANNAARRVCKWLEENNWILPPDLTPQQPIRNVSNPPGTWNDIKRSSEPQWRSTRSPFDEFFNFSRNQEARWRNYREGSWAPFGGEPDFKKTGLERELVCRLCGKKTKTGFVGAPEVFECMECQAKAYTNKGTKK